MSKHQIFVCPSCLEEVDTLVVGMSKGVLKCQMTEEGWSFNDKLTAVDIMAKSDDDCGCICCGGYDKLSEFKAEGHIDERDGPYVASENPPSPYILVCPSCRKKTDTLNVEMNMEDGTLKCEMVDDKWCFNDIPTAVNLLSGRDCSCIHCGAHHTSDEFMADGEVRL